MTTPTTAAERVTSSPDALAALAAYDDGTPSLLPDGNRYKTPTESHRWGRHYDRARAACPVCVRDAEDAEGGR